MEFSEFESMRGEILKSLSLSNRKKSLQAIAETLLIYKEYYANLHSGVHEGRMAEFAEKSGARIDTLISNVKKDNITAENQLYLLNIFADLLPRYTTIAQLDDFKNMVSQSDSLSQFYALFNKNPKSTFAEMDRIRSFFWKNAKSVKSVLTRFPEDTHKLISGFLNAKSSSQYFAGFFGGGGLSLMELITKAHSAADAVSWGHGNIVFGILFILVGIYAMFNNDEHGLSGVSAEDGVCALALMCAGVALFFV